MNDLAPALAHPSFLHKRSRKIETLNIAVHEFEHRKTGAMHYHLEADHDENVFMVALRTVPMNSTGVAHILEHTALCGSERFPVRDPFFWMIRRSLNTFMNAFTTSDYTAYPFASQNKKDFDNLLDVYLDAVFFSRLDPLDFAQEGHRLEFETPDDPSTDLVRRGVVFNEMKGDYSSPISILYEEFKKYLYPTTTYHYNSGGEPSCIPQLTYEELRKFYASHYHPSNAVFMTFGNTPSYELQHAFETRALCRFERSDKLIAVSAERRYSSPQQVSEPYGLDDDSTSGKTHIVIGWLLGENTDLEMLLKGNLLSDALLDTSASPLRLALESSPLAGAISPLSGLEEGNHEMSFMCGVEGSEPEHADAIEALVLETLNRVAEEGIAEDKLEACLHQLELNQREIGGDGAPFGLQLIFACMSAAIHRGDPIDLLDLDPVLHKLREEIKDPDFIKALVRSLLLDNPHRVRLTLFPDKDLNGQSATAEREELASIKSNLNDVGINALVTRAAELAARQDAEEDVAVLPKVGIADVPLTFAVPEGEVRQIGDIGLTYYPAGTNGLVYHQVVTRMPKLADDALALLPFYTSIITEVGSAGRDYLTTQHMQHSQTGGVSAFTSLRGNIDDPDRAEAHVTFSSRTLNRKCHEMIGMLADTVMSPNFSEHERIRDLVKQARVRREGSVTGNGHSLAMSAASSCFRPVAKLNHALSGLAAIARLKQFDDALDDKDRLDEFIDGLDDLHRQLTRGERELLVVSEPSFADEAMSGLLQRWQTIARGRGKTAITANGPESPFEQVWITTTQVNFCAVAFATVAESHPDAAALSVLGGVLRNGYLHKAVREQGGAYGAGATHDSSNGVFRFYSYRDPHLLRTFDAFRDSVDWVINQPIEFDLVEEALLGIMSSIDAPGSPAGQARQAYHHGLFGRTADHRRRIRSAILSVTVEDIKRVASVYLTGESARAVITSEAGAKTLPSTFAVNVI